MGGLIVTATTTTTTLPFTVVFV